jgi:hypothetical protein
MLTGSLPAVSNREDWSLGITVRDDTGALLDITGCVLSFAFEGLQSNVPILEGTSANGHIAIVNGPGGQALVNFSAEELSQLSPDTYEVGIRITLTTGERKQLFKGNVPVVNGVVSL